MRVARSINETPIAGQAFSLTCFAEIRTNATQSPLTLSWLRPLANSSLNSSHYHTLTEATFNSSTARLELQWSIVNMSQAGSYTCQAELQTGEKAMVTEEIVIQGTYCKQIYSISIHVHEPYIRNFPKCIAVIEMHLIARSLIP